MRIDVTCPSCFTGFTVKEELAGQRMKCRACGESLRVPDGTEEAAPRSSRSGGKRKKGRASDSDGLAMGLGIGVGGAAVVGLIVAVIVMSRGGTAPNPAPPAPIAAAPIAAAPVTPAPTATPVAGITPHATPTAVNTLSTNAAIPGSPATPPADTKAAETAAAKPENTTPEKKQPLDLPELIEAVEPSVVKITMDGSGTGSGYVVDTDGTVVTNYHVIAGVKSATVKFANGLEANVLGVRLTVPKKDIAIIKIDAPKDKLHPISLAKSLPKKGISVVAFGAPEGFSFSTTEGIVSAVRPAQELREEMGLDYEGTWVQTSTPLSPGMSGGPLVDRAGNVVAMTTLAHRTAQNLNFTISAIDVAEALAKAPQAIDPLNPTKYKEYDSHAARRKADEEIDTPKGRQLLSQTKEIFLLNATSKLTVALDPTGAVWDKVIRRSQVIVERCKIELSFGTPADDAAVMFVIFKMKPTRKGTAGTQELSVEAFLVCLDKTAKRDKNPYCLVWKDEETIGTISLEALATGNFPRTADDKLAKFFQGFQSAYLRSTKEPAKTDDVKKSEDESKTDNQK